MSHSIYLIDLQAHGLPEPATLQDMWQQIEPKLQQQAAPNPKFIELAQRLEKKFVPVDPGEDADRQDAAWLGNPVEQAKSLTQAAWNFGLPAEQIAEVLHEVVNQATQLGLAVLADYLGVGFLPGRKIVPASVTADWEAFYGEAPEPEPTKLSKAQVVKMFKTKLGERLAPHGFTLIKGPLFYSGGTKITDSGYFLRELADGRQLIRFGVGRSSGDLYCSFYAGGVNNTVRQLLKAAPLNGFFKIQEEGILGIDYGFNFIHTEFGRNWIVKALDGEQWPPGYAHPQLPLENKEGFRPDFAEQLLDAAAQALVSQLDQMKDVESIDEVLNKDIDILPGSLVRKNGYNGHVALVCGHLTGDPGFDDVVKACIKPYSSWTDEGSERSKAEIRQLAAYLREHVMPMKGVGGS